jgi:dephospho-CoA kinase
MRKWLSAATGIAVVDVPLLFEGSYQKEFDVTLAVSAPKAARLNRVRRRDGLSAAEVRRRMAAQISDARRERLADVVLRNEGAKATLKKNIREYFRALDLLGRGARALLPGDVQQPAARKN